jgi:hypothetical protein
MSGARLAMGVVALTISITACGNDITTPSSTSSTSSVAQTEFFSGTVWPGSESSYAFDVAQVGTVSETLGSVTRAGSGPAAVDAALTIGFGVPSGKGCARSASADAPAGLSAQLTADAPVGTHCADVSAPADAPGPFDFVVRIVHP